MAGLSYLYFGLEGHGGLVPWMWLSTILGLSAVILLLTPAVRRSDKILAVAAVAIFIATWIDKGLGLVVGGFVPTPLEKVTEYAPTLPEVLITVGVYALGFLILTVLYKVASGVKEEIAT
jgi:molybdopterin-containing oxidoreductase family membrane subunit